MADAGRVIAGTARGIRLVAPGEGTRPFTDRVKQTCFAILEPDLPDARVLDLFAGSGAAGIEALSRGAALAVLVERDRRAAAVIEENCRRAHVEARARIVRADAIAWLAGGGDGSGPFDLVVLDPPYADAALIHATLGLLGGADALGALVRQGSRVVVKRFWREPLPERIGLLASERESRFGETALAFYRVETEET